MNQEKRFQDPYEVFDKGTRGPFRAGMQNLHYQAQKAQQLCIWLAALCTFCVAAVLYIALTAQFKTYVVRVDNATGRVEIGGQLKATNYSPREAELRHFVAEFVSKIRTVPLDPIIYRKNWKNAQYFLTPEAAQKLNGLVRNEAQPLKLGKYTTQVNIRSIQKQPGLRNAYQVRWTEEIYNIQGGKSEEANYYVALFSVIIAPPGKEEELLINPLGMKIADLTYTKESIRN